MPAILDHIHMGCANVNTTAFDLTKTTRIGHYDGGFTGNVSIGQKTMPLGRGVFMEIESIVDPFATADAAARPWWYKRAVAVRSPIFSGLRLRVNTIEELGEIARRHGGAVRPKMSIRTPPDGPQVKSWDAPYAAGVPEPWASGKPTWCCWRTASTCTPAGSRS